MSRGPLQKMLRRNRYEKRTEHIFCTRSQKWSENQSSPFEPKILLISFSRGSGPLFKVGLGISQTNADSQWNPVYNAFHRFFFVETKRFVGSFVHVILVRQTCGQRSSKAAESKRRALGNYFSERICYMFSISKCRGD